MKRFLINSMLFGMFMMAFYTVFLFVLVNNGPELITKKITKKLTKNINYRIGSYGHMFTRVREIPNYQNVDILFLGSSHAYRGFDTRIFEKQGYRSFNLGSSSQSPIQTQVLLKRYLNNFQPKLIVYEVYPGTFCVDGVEAAVDIIANDKNDWQSFGMVLQLKSIKAFNTWVYGFTRDLFGLNLDFSEPVVRSQDLDTYISGGFVEKQVFHYKGGEQMANHWEFKESQFDTFKEIMDELKSEGYEVILVYAPITQSYYNSYDNNPTFDSTMSLYGKYINFNDIMSLNDSMYFYDPHHLNQLGVQEFNEKLLEVIDK